MAQVAGAAAQVHRALTQKGLGGGFVFMKGDRHTRQARGLGAAILPPFALALALASAAEAQDAGSVQDFQLKPGAPAPTPTAAGPVDAEDPAARPARPVSLPAPRPAPTSGAAPSPTIRSPTIRAVKPPCPPDPSTQRVHYRVRDGRSHKFPRLSVQVPGVWLREQRTSLGHRSTQNATVAN